MQGPQGARGLSCAMTPARTFLASSVIILCLFYAIAAAFQRRMAGLEARVC